MCRLLLSVGEEVPLQAVVSAKCEHKRSKLFGLQREERLHGFGIAWAATDAAGCVVTLRPPLDDLNVRRVAAVTLLDSLVVARNSWRGSPT